MVNSTDDRSYVTLDSPIHFKYTEPSVPSLIVEMLHQFVNKHQIRCAEDLYQNDNVVMGASPLIEQMIETVGCWYVDPAK